MVGGLEHFLFFHILGIIIPIDSYFSEGWPNHQPDNPRLVHEPWVKQLQRGGLDEAMKILEQRLEADPSLCTTPTKILAWWGNLFPFQDISLRGIIWNMTSWWENDRICMYIYIYICIYIYYMYQSCICFSVYQISRESCVPWWMQREPIALEKKNKKNIKDGTFTSNHWWLDGCWANQRVNGRITFFQQSTDPTNPALVTLVLDLFILRSELALSMVRWDKLEKITRSA